jgi:hypothetical protein
MTSFSLYPIIKYHKLQKNSNIFNANLQAHSMVNEFGGEKEQGRPELIPVYGRPICLAPNFSTNYR